MFSQVWIYEPAWDTVLIAIEIIVVILLGLLPEDAPDQICQVALNFICSMQRNTFRQVQGVPAATTFITNHIRQVGTFWQSMCGTMRVNMLRE